MRRLMILFGLLDFGIVATYGPRVPRLVHGLAHQPWLNSACLLMLVSLLVSGFGLIRARQWALVLNYLQFPFRLILAFLSFAWLAQLVLPAHPTILTNEAVWGSAVVIEGIRLGISIMLHVGVRRAPCGRPLIAA